MLPKLSYKKYTSITGAADYFVKMRDFFKDTLKWTEVEYYAGTKQWKTSSPYTGWVNGSEYWLDVKSSGHSSQSMRYCFKGEEVDATRSLLTIGGSLHANTYVADVKTHPIEQTVAQSGFCWNVEGYVNQGRFISLPTSDFGGSVWFFGNDYCMFSVMQYTTNNNVLWGVGCPTLDNDYKSTTDHLFLYIPQHYHTSSSTASCYWDNMSSNKTNWWCGWMYPCRTTSSSNSAYNYYYAYIDGQPRQDYDSGKSCVYNVSANGRTGSFDLIDSMIALNNFNQTRMIVQPRVYIKDVSTGKWHCVGTMPFGEVRMDGLSSGTEITKDVGGGTTEKYVLFHNRYFSDPYGKCVRIA